MSSSGSSLTASPPTIGIKRCFIETSRHLEASTKYPKLCEDFISLENTRRIPRLLKNKLISDKWIIQDPTSKNRGKPPSICSACIALANETTGQITSPNTLSCPESSIIRKSVQIVIDLINAGSLHKEEVAALASTLGGLEKPQFKLRARLAAMKVEDCKQKLLVETYEESWKRNDCQAFKYFGEALCDLKTCSEEQRRRSIRHLSSAADSLCMAINERYITPMAAAQNIVLHSYSGSKTACQLLGAVQPSGSYKYLEKIVEKLSQEPPKFPTGDIYVVFDNQQILGREYRVTPGGSQPMSTVCSLAVIQEDVDLNLQYHSITTNLNLSVNRVDLWNKYKNFSQTCRFIHHEYQSKWLNSRLQILIHEFTREDGKLENPETKAFILSPEYEDGLRYSRVPEVKSSCKVQDMQNLIINPNSYDGVEKVLSEIERMSNDSCPERKWITVICDGVPYTIGTNLINKSLECTTCGQSGMKLSCKDLPDHETTKKFKKIVLKPGPGHFELNLVRAIFHVFFDIFIKPAAIMLGFTTPRSLEYCKKALDHHKSWQILQIVYVALTDELLHQYVKRSSTSNVPATVEEYKKWFSDVRWGNYQMAADFCFNILHPLFLFRAGIRQCNDEVAMAGLQKGSGVFFGFNHPKYRIITAQDTFFNLNLPLVGAEPAKKLGFRLAKSGYGQGGDFHIEERNKMQKHWCFSHGPPTEVQWQKTSSTLTFFENLKEKVLKEVDINEEGWKPRHIPLGEAYYLMRLHYREILSLESSELTTFCENRDSLPMKFLNCAYTCDENKRKFMQAFLNEEKCVLNLVDTSDLEKMDIEELRKRAASKIRQLTSQSKKAMQELFNKCSTVEDLVSLLGEIEEEICNIDYMEHLMQSLQQ